MEYNQMIESKENLMRDFARFFNLDFNFGVKLRLADVKIHQPKYSYIDCMIKAESYNYNIDFIIDVISESGTETQTVTIKIPKMSNKGFLIFNAEGVFKWRSCINIGEIRKRIRLYKNKIESKFFNIDLSLGEDKNGTYHPEIIIEGKSYNLLAILLSNGYTKGNLFSIFLPDDRVLMDRLLVDAATEDVSEFEFPKVDQNFIDKFYHVTDIECKEQLTASDIVELIKVAKNNPDKLNQITPFDVNFISDYNALITELNAGSYELILKIVNHYSKHRYYNGEILNKSISKIFSMEKNKYSIIQTASDSNPAGFLGQSRKTYFYTARGSKVPLSYNETFVGLICPLKTPESVSLVNIKNELARDVDISDGKPMILLMDKNFNKVRLDYSQYYRSKVLTYECFDYDDRKITPKNGNIEYWYRGKYHVEKYENDNQFDYIRFSENSILSYNASLIPMMNKNDSVRLAMGTNMIDQAIPTVGSSPAICATGIEREVFEQSDWSYKSPYSGTVTDIIDNYIKIKDESGVSHIVSTPPGFKSTNGTYNRYDSNVKVGDEVKAGDVIVASNSFKQDQLCLTSQLVIAFDNYGFYDEEDGVILSSDATEILGHDVTKELVIQIPTKYRCVLNKNQFVELSGIDRALVSRLNDFGLPKVGDKFKKGDIVATVLEESNPEKYYRPKIKRRVHKGASDMITMFYELPYGMDEGVVEKIDVLIPKGITEDGLPEVRNYYDEEFYKYEKEVSQRLHEIVSIKREAIDPSFRVTIKIKFRYINKASVGSKVSNVYASKGSIVKVIDKDFMPRIGGPDGRRVQIIINPKSTFNRKNIAQLITAKLGYLSALAHDRHTEYINNGEFDKVRFDLNKLYVTQRFTNYTDEELIKFHSEFGWYYQLKVTPTDKKYTEEVVRDLSKYFGVPLEQGEKLYLPEYNTYTEFPVEVGIASIMRLHFFPEHKMSATGSFYTGDELKYGIGKYRSGGQAFGEMENWAAAAHGTTDVIDELTGTNLSNTLRPRIETEFLMIGLAINPMKMLQ